MASNENDNANNVTGNNENNENRETEQNNSNNNPLRQNAPLRLLPAPEPPRWFCAWCQQYQPVTHYCNGCGKRFTSCCNGDNMCFYLNGAIHSIVSEGLCYNCKHLLNQGDVENDQDRPNRGGPPNPRPPPPGPAVAALDRVSNAVAEFYSADGGANSADGSSRGPYGEGPVRGSGRPGNAPPAADYEGKMVTIEDLVANNGYGIYGDYDGGWYLETPGSDFENNSDNEMVDEPHDAPPQGTEEKKTEKKQEQKSGDGKQSTQAATGSGSTGPQGQSGSSGASGETSSTPSQGNNDDVITPEDREVEALMRSQHETELALDEARKEARTLKVKAKTYFDKPQKFYSKKKKGGPNKKTSPKKKYRTDSGSRCRPNSPQERDSNDSDSDDGYRKRGFHVVPQH